MHLSTTAVLTVWAACCCAPAWALEGWDGEPALRLPGEPGVQAWSGASSGTLRDWARDVSLRLSERSRSSRTLYSLQAPTEQSLRIERSRSTLALHWRPWAAGGWALGATVGLYRALPGSAKPCFAAMPVASYEQPNYRVNVGLMRPRDDRSSVLVVGLMLPLR